MNSSKCYPAKPPSDDPADQPKDCRHDCETIPNPTPPTVPEPEKCKPKCECPHPSTTTTPNCLDDLIAKQNRAINEAERAQAFKAELESMLVKSKAAQIEYTQEKYSDLVEAWQRNDHEIVDLIRKLVCATPCWECLLECYVCPLLEEVRYRETMLYGDGTLYPEVKTLYDLLYWHERSINIAQRRYNRIKGVLAAWEQPTQTIESVIAENSAMITDSANLIGSDAAKVVYDVFVKLVPLHLAIAPQASSGTVTSIPSNYTTFCECDVGEPDDCCGPDVGKPTLRQRLIGPQPYLVLPSDYFSIICCLTEKRYLPAKEALAEAESSYAEVDSLIKRLTTEVDEAMTPLSFENATKAAFPADCKWWEDGGSQQPDQATAQSGD